MSQVTGKKVAVTPMPTPSGTSGAIIDSFNTQDDQTVNAPSIHIVKDALTTINDNLSGFKFYPTGTDIVGLISDDSAYIDENGNYVIWGTATANQLVADNPNTYKSVPSEEDTRGKVGADTATPFNVKAQYIHKGYISASNSNPASITINEKGRYLIISQIYGNNSNPRDTTTLSNAVIINNIQNYDSRVCHRVIIADCEENCIVNTYCSQGASSTEKTLLNVIKIPNKATLDLINGSDSSITITHNKKALVVFSYNADNFGYLKIPNNPMLLDTEFSITLSEPAFGYSLQEIKIVNFDKTNNITFNPNPNSSNHSHRVSIFNLQ